MPDDSAADAAFWEEAGALLHEVMADCKLSQPVRVSLLDVQARIRYRFSQVADAALREARAEILNLKIDLEHERFICTSELEIRDADIAHLRGEIESLQADAANDAGRSQAHKAALQQVLEVIGVSRGDDHWPQFVERLRAEIARLRAAPSARVVDAALAMYNAYKAFRLKHDPYCKSDISWSVLPSVRMMDKALAEHDAAPPARVVEAARDLLRHTGSCRLVHSLLCELENALIEHAAAPPDLAEGE